MHHSLRFIQFVMCFCFLAMSFFVCGQPVLPRKKTIEGVAIYPDLKQKNTWYYSPGQLRMAVDLSGKPQFQLLQMRYTGFFAGGTQGQIRFMNVVQVSIRMEQPSSTVLKSVQQQLGTKATLNPIPMRNVEANLLVPVANNTSQYTHIGSTAGMEGNDPGGGAYWTERTFTLRLENHDAQILWDQVATGRLAMSVNYAYLADAITEISPDLKVTGNAPDVSTTRSNMQESVVIDSVPQTEVILSDAFKIQIDVQKWPELLKKIDLNDEAPPAYAALNLVCYDFSNELRPDLAMKSVEIEARGVEDQPVKITGKRFSSAKPDQTTLQIRFPYAIKISRPYRYRVIEYSSSGLKKELPWQYRENWTEILDVTTPAALNTLKPREVEIEMDTAYHSIPGFEELSVVFLFPFNGEDRRLSVSWKASEELPLKVLRFFSDKDKGVVYYARWKVNGVWKSGRRSTLGVDDYVFVKRE